MLHDFLPYVVSNNIAIINTPSNMTWNPFLHFISIHHRTTFTNCRTFYSTKPFPTDYKATCFRHTFTSQCHDLQAKRINFRSKYGDTFLWYSTPNQKKCVAETRVVSVIRVACAKYNSTDAIGSILPNAVSRLSLSARWNKSHIYSTRRQHNLGELCGRR